MAKTEEKQGGGHKATYSADKRNGGYNVRVVGPHANRFAGRVVPVYRLDGTYNEEKLIKVLHSGTDDGSVIPSNAGKPYALYSFEQHKREEADEIPF